MITFVMFSLKPPFPNPKPAELNTEPVEANNPEPIKANNPKPIEANNPKAVKANNPEPIEANNSENNTEAETVESDALSVDPNQQPTGVAGQAVVAEPASLSVEPDPIEDNKIEANTEPTEDSTEDNTKANTEPPAPQDLLPVGANNPEARLGMVEEEEGDWGWDSFPSPPRDLPAFLDEMPTHQERRRRNRQERLPPCRDYGPNFMMKQENLTTILEEDEIEQEEEEEEDEVVVVIRRIRKPGWRNKVGRGLNKIRRRFCTCF